jgi:hypothetical protein
MLMGDGEAAFYDGGFYNIGVTPTLEDVGRGGKGPGDRPLASSRQYLFDAFGINGPIDFPIIGLPIRDLESVGPVFAGGKCQKPILKTTDGSNIEVCRDLNCNGVCDRKDKVLLKRVAVDGAFKTPQLRNVELSGPYWHNGGAATLMQVVEFYDDGGNFCRANFPDLDPDIERLGLDDKEREGLVAFLLALTDERVRREQAPFDHPELRIPNGHPGDERRTVADKAFRGEQALDVVLKLPAVGAGGQPRHRELEPFHKALDRKLDHFDITNPVQNVPCRRPNQKDEAPSNPMEASLPQGQKDGPK